MSFRGVAGFVLLLSQTSCVSHLQSLCETKLTRFWFQRHIYHTDMKVLSIFTSSSQQESNYCTQLIFIHSVQQQMLHSDINCNGFVTFSSFTEFSKGTLYSLLHCLQLLYKLWLVGPGPLKAPSV